MRPRARLPRAASLREAACLAAILALALALRLYGLDWDGGHWLHPDERQVFFVAMRLGWPGSLAEALSPASPLNPGFFAYGSLPIYLLKLLAALLALLWPALGQGDNLHLVGRPLSALVDVGSVYLTYRLARRLAPPSPAPGAANGGALLAAALAGLALLPLQIAHFYTVDTLLTFTILLTLNLAACLARGGGLRRQAALGVALGLALATKVSAAPLLLAVLVATHVQPPAAAPPSNTRRAHALRTLRRLALTLAVAAAVALLAQPYALLDWQTFLADTGRESAIASGQFETPYVLQFAGTWPFLYSMWQAALWGLGLPLGLAAWLAFALAFRRWLRRGRWADALLLAWAGPYFLVVGLSRARYLRYVLPLVPVLCILVAGFVAGLGRRRLRAAVQAALVLPTLACSLLFLPIYATPHPWIQASDWIYDHVPPGSTLAIEHWDRALPLPLEREGVFLRSSRYDVRVLPLYDEPDDDAKWQALAADLARTDYLILATRRLYGSIPRLPDRYPLATRYYDRLLAGDLGFELVAEFTRGPAWLNPRIPPLPGAAPALLRPDESFVVYDHPRALILRNAAHLRPRELLDRLAAAGAKPSAAGPGTSPDTVPMD
jgi:hypothetical protein